MTGFWLTVLILCLVPRGYARNSLYKKPPLSQNRSGEERLVTDLLARYATHSPSVRPVADSTDQMDSKFALALVQILDFDELNNKLKILAWKQNYWHDPYMVWEPSDYDDIESIVLHTELVWVPDVMLVNSIGDASVEKDTLGAMIRVTHEGGMWWYPPVKYESSCMVNMIEYPFDVQTCQLVFGSAHLHAYKLNLTLGTHDRVEPDHMMHMNYFMGNSEFEIVGNMAERTLQTYTCCENPYVILTYTLTLERKMTFHMRLFLVPTPILSLLSIFIFWIPPVRTDRTMFGLSLFSAFFLLLLLVVSSTPPTSSARISHFYVSLLKMVFFSVFVSLLTINLTNSTRRMPTWLDKVIVRPFSFLLCSKTCLETCQREPEGATSTEIEGDDGEETEDSERNRKTTSLRDSADNKKKWRSLALIFDRIFFLCFLVALIYNYVVNFPQPSKMWKILW